MVDDVEALTVRQSASVVWAVLADFDAISRRAPNVDHSCLATSAAAGVGVTRRIQTGRATVFETVTEWWARRLARPRARCSTGSTRIYELSNLNNSPSSRG